MKIRISSGDLSMVMSIAIVKDRSKYLLNNWNNAHRKMHYPSNRTKDNHLKSAKVMIHCKSVKMMTVDRDVDEYDDGDDVSQESCSN